ncbi:hypothetical protein [Actinacidiphila glaucinigra]|uniref:hypothetical protein n=1 Tax=Actinacidiphila glaucinigra TaxID=235986 RepID=UPI0035D9E4B1
MSANNRPLLVRDTDDPQLQAKPDRSWHESIRERWNDAWSEEGVLYSLWDDLRHAPSEGWHGMAHWIKALLAAAGASLLILLINGAAEVLWSTANRILTAAPHMQVGTDTSTGVWAVIDQPVRAYLVQHSAGLAVSASTVYTLWQLTGLVALVLGFLTRSNGIRLMWIGWGAATTWAVWTASPPASQTVAAGIAVLAWSFASAFALRGLNLRPRVFTHIHNTAPEFRPHITIQAQPPADTTDDTDRELD